MITSANVVNPMIKQGPPQSARPEPTQSAPAAPPSERAPSFDGPAGPTPAFQETFLARVARTALDVRATDTSFGPPRAESSVDTALDLPAFAQPGNKPTLPDAASDRARVAIAERGAALPAAASDRAALALAVAGAGAGRDAQIPQRDEGVPPTTSAARSDAPIPAEPNDPTGNTASATGQRSTVVDQMLRDLNVFAPPPLPLVDLKG